MVAKKGSTVMFWETRRMKILEHWCDGVGFSWYWGELCAALAPASPDWRWVARAVAQHVNAGTLN